MAEERRGDCGDEPSTHAVPPVVLDGDGDGLDAYRAAQHVPVDLRLREGEAALIIVRGWPEGSVHHLGPDRVEIGRDGDIALRHQTVSRRHAAVERVDDAFVITDLGSLNGLHVNGSPVERAVLRHGDQVQIGMFKLLFVATER